MPSVGGAAGGSADFASILERNLAVPHRRRKGIRDDPALLLPGPCPGERLTCTGARGDTRVNIHVRRRSGDRAGQTWAVTPGDTIWQSKQETR